ncbi:MAG: FkbM family methyltransferase [Solirubrobacteraceae bacterium]
MRWSRERLLGRTYRALAASDLVTRAALHLRGVASAVLGKRLARSTLPHQNGELWLAGELADAIEVAVDVGANVGDWSAMALARFPKLARLVAFEPGAVAVSLRTRLRDDPRATVIEAAVSDSPGSVTLFEQTDDTKLSSLIPTAFTTPRTVDCVRLDDELARLGLPRVDLLKIDAEGLDLHVLRGASGALAERRIAAVQFEYGPLWQQAGSTLHAAYRLLGEAGYRTLLITPRGLREFPVTQITELYVYANFVALAPSLAERFSDSIRPIW